MRTLFLSALLGGTLALPAQAADLKVAVEIPRLNVAEYHRPYVAIWIEREDQSVAADLAVWYDLDKKDNEGAKWLKDIRQWWRRSGREHRYPIDGVSGATRPVGRHALDFPGDQTPLAGLPPGQYNLVVEAAREKGERELLRLPFAWPPAQPAHANAQGATELGKVALDLAP